MRVLMPGGSGHVGQALRRHFEPLGWDFVVLSRSNSPDANTLQWDGKTLGSWAKEIERADVVINLAGRSVNCRYTAANLREMTNSRVDSTKAIGAAIAQASRKPRIWLQASTATIYAHRTDADNDEVTGVIGGGEPGAPPKWNASIAIAKEWEAAAKPIDGTRLVLMRSAMTMSIDRGGVFDVLASLARRGLGGTMGDGTQFVSWIHEQDFARSIKFLVEREDLSGPITICSPNPLPNREFMRTLRESVGARIGVRTPAWLLEMAAAAMGTETELILKSRRVVPRRLQEAGFRFDLADWPSAAMELATRWRQQLRSP